MSLTWFSAMRDPYGVVTIDIHPNGAATAERWRRTGPIPPEAPTVAVPREALALYAGRYVTAAGRVLTIALGEDGRLTSQIEQQRPIRMRATSQTEFEEEGFLSRIVFHAESGAVNRLVIHQDGREIPATRETAPPAS